jgi:hypothetical protein
MSCPRRIPPRLEIGRNLGHRAFCHE